MEKRAPELLSLEGLEEMGHGAPTGAPSKSTFAMGEGACTYTLFSSLENLVSTKTFCKLIITNFPSVPSDFNIKAGELQTNGRLPDLAVLLQMAS